MTTRASRGLCCGSADPACRTIMAEKGWTPSRLKAADDFWAVQERLQRRVWGVGILQAIFARENTPVPWYQDWAKHQVEARTRTTEQK